MEDVLVPPLSQEITSIRHDCRHDVFPFNQRPYLKRQQIAFGLSEAQESRAMASSDVRQHNHKE